MRPIGGKEGQEYYGHSQTMVLTHLVDTKCFVRRRKFVTQLLGGFEEA